MALHTLKAEMLSRKEDIKVPNCMQVHSICLELFLFTDLGLLDVITLTQGSCYLLFLEISDSVLSVTMFIVSNQLFLIMI